MSIPKERAFGSGAEAKNDDSCHFQNVRSDAAGFEEDHEVESRFECPICLQCLNDPILTTCGHRFCRGCIHKWLKTKGSCCPVDNRPLSINTDLFPDNYTRREIQALESNSSAHDNNHQPQVLLECANKGVGCMMTFSNKSDLFTHNDTNVQHHLNLLSAAYNKLCVSMSDAKAHEAATLWEPDAKTKPAQTDWQGLVRSLYERIVLLEQQNREQAIQIDHLKLQIETNRSDIKKTAEHLSTAHCNGTYIWSISNFSAKMKAQLWTPGFYTSPTGYKFCARLNTSHQDADILALHIHLMKTEHDSCLDWPFRGKIYFVLVNENMHFNKQDVMVASPELIAFQRPMSDIHPRAFGFSNYITIQELKKGFWKNDCLTIQIKIVQDKDVRAHEY